MYYVIQVFMFDALFSAIYVDENGEQNLRTDIVNYKDLLTECYNNQINKIILSGDNKEFVSGIAKEVQLLEHYLFNENKIEIEVIGNVEVIPE